ncbi:MAG: hypothetical protein Q9175_008300 [Cornicularia normoerica]
MSNVSDQALFEGHLEDIERLLHLSCPNGTGSMIMKRIERAVAVKMTYQQYDSYGFETGAGSTFVDPVIVRLINCLYGSDVDILTSVERLSGIRTQIPSNIELTMDIRKAIEHRIGHLAVTAGISFGVATGINPENVNDSTDLAKQKIPKA